MRSPECRELSCVTGAVIEDEPFSSSESTGSFDSLLNELGRIPQKASAPAIGAQLDEYRVLRKIGRGGMGEVYLAHDELLDRPVALKLIEPRSQSEDLRQRFLIEARAIARLQHPNVVAIHRIGHWS